MVIRRFANRGLGGLLLLGALGCGPAKPAVVDAAVDLALEPLLDPALFDCTSLGPDGQRLPERRSAVPAACALDPRCRPPQIAGHRGVGGTLGRLAPEDTLAAYRAAIVLGIEYVETDPRPTADGVLINLHDPTVNRTTGGSGAVENMTLAQVRALSVSATMPGDFRCEKVPTLLEVLQLCRGRVTVLVDANKTDRVDLLVKAIQEAKAVDWAIFDTSSIDKIDRALVLEPRLHFQIRPGSVAEITTQLDHFKPRVPVIVELEPKDRAPGAAVVHQRGSRAFVDVFVEDAAAALGHDLSGYGRALDDGVDILQSDVPDLVLLAYRRRGLR